MHRCPTCDLPLEPNATHCPHCDADGPTLRCGRCGEEYRDADACPSCGTLREEVPCETHSERVAEGRCVVCGRAVCQACAAAEPRALRCAEHGRVMVIQGWAQVYSTTREFEAQLVRENLRAEGIDAQIYSQRDSIFSVDIGELSIVRLLVPAWEYEPALTVIRSHMDAEGEVAFACPSCGEAHEPGSARCAACGEPLE
jgi:hypothetical protein